MRSDSRDKSHESAECPAPQAAFGRVVDPREIELLQTQLEKSLESTDSSLLLPRKEAFDKRILLVDSLGVPGSIDEIVRWRAILSVNEADSLEENLYHCVVDEHKRIKAAVSINVVAASNVIDRLEHEIREGNLLATRFCDTELLVLLEAAAEFSVLLPQGGSWCLLNGASEYAVLAASDEGAAMFLTGDPGASKDFAKWVSRQQSRKLELGKTKKRVLRLPGRSRMGIRRHWSDEIIAALSTDSGRDSE